MVKPYGECDIDNDSPNALSALDTPLYNLIKNSMYQYKRELCFTLCLQRLSLISCNCTNPMFFSLFNDNDFCLTNDEIYCTDSIFGVKSIKTIYSDCLKECPLECNTTVYEYALTSVDLIGELYSDFISKSLVLSSDFTKKTINAETSKKSFVKFFLSYSSLSYKLFTETPSLYLVDLLGNIGGNIGLFLGISLLSICEVVEVIVEIILLITKKNRK
jgi:hypothetical protein